ncbi:hypothetical protein GDO78_017085 [Eleutherodactylus coqui]|uniref:Ig-like domain-containing protein n=1 Tax=Eleutherodactylus coqui TaxID=57060 RepID=A0A8J6B8W2_ELECQ|nr:hypothetical protein GDO78_017085 [Eleutherodactylus coqui]
MQPQILLGLVALILFPSGEALSHEISEALHYPKNLTTSFHPNLVQDITWIHNISGKETLIAKTGGLRDHLNSEYKLFCNGTVLGISDLKANNCGLYIAQVTFWNNTTEKEEFNVTLIDPVPPVQITPEVKRIGNQCNITLKCSAPSNTSDLSYTWMNRYWDSQYQSTATTGNIMQTVLPLDHQEMEYMCMVENLADQKNISVHIETCSVKVKNDQSADNKRNLIIVLTVVMVVAGAVMAVLGWKYWKRSSKTSEDTFI